MLTLAAFLFVQWSPADRLRGWLLIATAPLVAYGFNLLRVCFIIPDPTSDLSATHTVQGWAAFFGALAVLVVIDRLLGRLLPGRGRPRSTSFDASDRPQPAAGVLALASSRAGAWSVALAAMLASLLGVSLWMPEWSPPEGEGRVKDPPVNRFLGPASNSRLPWVDGGWARRSRWISITSGR